MSQQLQLDMMGKAKEDTPPAPPPEPMILVNRNALVQLLNALEGPGHLIRELQVTRNVSKMTGQTHPIDILRDNVTNPQS